MSTEIDFAKLREMPVVTVEQVHRFRTTVLDTIDSLRAELEAALLGASEEYIKLRKHSQDIEAERDRFKYACTEWIEKTEWVPARCASKELGFHRADILHDWLLVAEAERDQLTKDAEQMRAALQDCRGGLIYIREQHGELYGVGFDRAIGLADAALANQPAEDE